MEPGVNFVELTGKPVATQVRYYCRSLRRQSCPVPPRKKGVAEWVPGASFAREGASERVVRVSEGIMSKVRNGPWPFHIDLSHPFRLIDNSIYLMLG